MADYIAAIIAIFVFIIGLILVLPDESSVCSMVIKELPLENQDNFREQSLRNCNLSGWLLMIGDVVTILTYLGIIKK